MSRTRKEVCRALETESQVQPEGLQEVQRKVGTLLREKKKQEEEERRFDEHIWRIEKEQELERIVRRKLELEKLRNQTQLLDRMIDNKHVDPLTS